MVGMTLGVVVDVLEIGMLVVLIVVFGPAHSFGVFVNVEGVEDAEDAAVAVAAAGYNTAVFVAVVVVAVAAAAAAAAAAELAVDHGEVQQACYAQHVGCRPVDLACTHIRLNLEAPGFLAGGEEVLGLNLDVVHCFSKLVESLSEVVGFVGDGGRERR